MEGREAELSGRAVSSQQSAVSSQHWIDRRNRGFNRKGREDRNETLEPEFFASFAYFAVTSSKGRERLIL
jgi:hypothetical protein